MTVRNEIARVRLSFLFPPPPPPPPYKLGSQNTPDKLGLNDCIQKTFVVADQR